MIARGVRLSGLLIRSLAIVMMILAGSAGPILGAPAAVEPKEIILTLADLPEGFTPDPRYMGPEYVEGVGPSERAQYTREITRETVLAGPILVTQLVIKLEGALGAGDTLQLARNIFIQNHGLTPSSSGPNDGGTFTLERMQNNIKTYAVGFIKDNMIIVTMAGGLPTVMTTERVLELAGISSGKMDAAKGR